MRHSVKNRIHSIRRFRLNHQREQSLRLALNSICGSKIVFEDNKFSGGLFSGGNNIALFGPKITRHVLYRRNSVNHLYTEDHECLTLEGHGLGYSGKVKNVKGTSFELSEKILAKTGPGKGIMCDLIRSVFRER